jgi:hypothetical protein
VRVSEKWAIFVATNDKRQFGDTPDRVETQQLLRDSRLHLIVFSVVTRRMLRRCVLSEKKLWQLSLEKCMLGKEWVIQIV